MKSLNQLFVCRQAAERRTLEAFQRRELLSHAAETGEELQLWLSQGSQRLERQPWWDTQSDVSWTLWFVDALELKINRHFVIVASGVQHQQVSTESLLLEAVKQVKVSDLEDDVLELLEEDPASANQWVSVEINRSSQSQGF